MATPAQVEANRENAKHSPGPTSDAGKEVSSRNNFRHGLSGHVFMLLDWENPENYDFVKEEFRQEHRPQTITELTLVEKMAQYYWLSQRAHSLQGLALTGDPLDNDPDVKALNLYMRYQSHHERLFQRALHDLLKLKAEKRRQQIGFESQKRAQAQETRREAAEIRKIEYHELRQATLTARLNRAPNVSEASVPAAESPKAAKIAA